MLGTPVGIADIKFPLLYVVLAMSPYTGLTGLDSVLHPVLFHVSTVRLN